MNNFNLSDNIKYYANYEEDDKVLLVKDVKRFIDKLKKDDVNALAKFMHNVYEDYAKLNGWDTQEKCKVEFEELPKKNKQVMIHTAMQVIGRNNIMIDKLSGDVK